MEEGEQPKRVCLRGRLRGRGITAGEDRDVSQADPNWGRILAAVGRAGVADLDLARIRIWLNGVCIVRGGGRDADYTEAAGAEAVSRDEIVIRIALGRGRTTDRVWTCDFSHQYVTINAEYRT